MREQWKGFISALRHDRRVQMIWLAPVFVVTGIGLAIPIAPVFTVLNGALCCYALALLFKTWRWPSYVGATLTVAAALHAILYGLPGGRAWWAVLVLQVATWPVCFWLQYQWQMDLRAAALLVDIWPLPPLERAVRWYIGEPSLRVRLLHDGEDPELIVRASRILMDRLDERQRRELSVRIDIERVRREAPHLLQDDDEPKGRES